MACPSLAGLSATAPRPTRRGPRHPRDGELAFIGWSEWSESYLPTNGVSEATITSPNPRKFLQIRVNISSRDPFKTARLGFLRVDLAPPLALELAYLRAFDAADVADRSLQEMRRSMAISDAQAAGWKTEPLCTSSCSATCEAAALAMAASKGLLVRRWRRMQGRLSHWLRLWL